MMRRTKLFSLSIFILAFASFSAQAFENVYPSEAYEMTTNDENTFIIDVRTEAEWTWVGHPGMNKSGDEYEDGHELVGKVVNVSWMIIKKGSWVLNLSFLSDMDDIFPNKEDVTLITMCKSGTRSSKAASALEGEGYDVVNMVTGFEGGADDYGYRTISGWKVDGLPYRTSSPKFPDGYPD